MRKARAAGESSCLRAGLVRAFTLLLFLILALPARAGDARAVKLRVPPSYPEIARRMKVTGEVKLEVVVDADGKVKEARAVSGNRILAEAAEDAVRKWKFEAGNGETTELIAVNFTLNE